MRSLLTTTTALLALAASAAAPLLAAAPADAAETIAIKPASLPRGPDIAGAHLDGTTIVDGDVEVLVKRPNVILYGKWHDQYVAATGSSAWDNVKLVRISASGKVTLLREFIDPFTAVLDAENDQIAYSYGGNTQKPTLAVYDLGLDDEVQVHGFVAMPDLLAFGDGVMVAAFGPPKAKTITWNTVTDEIVKVVTKQGNYASVAHDLLGYYSKDPQRGGCQVLAHLSDPGDVLWTNCDERIDAASPDGKRFATIPLLTDGLGARDVIVRKANGKELAHYTVNSFFGTVWWESDTELLLNANGKTQAATVRCVVAVCNRATDLRPTPDF
jgi:hypothetical protein